MQYILGVYQPFFLLDINCRMRLIYNKGKDSEKNNYSPRGWSSSKSFKYREFWGGEEFFPSNSDEAFQNCDSFDDNY